VSRDGCGADRGGRAARDERGAALIEFALVLPLTVLILFGLIDFGFIFHGYSTMRNGVQAGARLASENEYTYSGTASCGATDATSQMVCTVASSIGGLYGVSGNLRIGIVFSTARSQGQGGQDVTVCASAQLNSTSGLLYRTFAGDTMTSASTVLLAATPSYATFNSGSVTYNGATINGMPCP
jgi:Flp pilus assembly protein TadG